MSRKAAPIVLALLLAVALVWAADEVRFPDGDNANDGNTSCDTNAYLTVNEDPQGGDWCTADNNNVNWTLTFTTADPSGALDTTTDAQVIRIYARSFDEGQGGDPTIQVSIYDTTTVACDTLHEAGTITTLTDAGFPAEISESWTAAGLSSENDVCIEIDCVKSGGAPGDRNSCDLDAVVWDVTLAAAGGRTRRML